MTPAKRTVFIDTVSGFVSANIGGQMAVDPQFILRTGANLEVAFVTEGAVVELAADATGRLVLKELGNGDGPALFLDTAWEKTGTGTATRYKFVGEMDGVALRTSLASGLNKQFGASILFKEPADAHDSASLPFAVTVNQNYHRSDDAAPIVSQDVSLVLNSEETALEIFINGVSKKFLRITNEAS
jgi:hypothetical protein